MSTLIIQEHSSSSYAPRTYHNASVADLTMALAVDHNTAGEKCTQKAAGDRIVKLHHQAGDNVQLARELWKGMKKHNAKILNVAGNGIYTWMEHGIQQERLNQNVYEILKLVHEHWGIEKIVSGGQTGTDIAGLAAAYKLGIDAVGTWPKGFKMRFADGIDVELNEVIVRNYVEHYASLLE